MGINAKMGLLLSAMILLAVPVVYAEEGMMGQGDMHQEAWHHGGDHEEYLAKILGLSEAQVKQIKDLHQKEHESTKEAFDQIGTNGEALEAELIKPNADMNKINDLESKMKAIGAQMVDDHLNTTLAIKKILTPEQFAGYMALKKEKEVMMKHMHERFGHQDGWDNKDQKHHPDGGQD